MRIPKNLRKYTLWLLIASAPFPIYSALFFSAIQDISPKIKTIEEAHEVLGEEKSKLGIEDKVAIIINDEDKLKKIKIGGFCGRNDEGYVIGADMSNLSRFLLKHELYHLFRDGCPKFRPTIEHFVEDAKIKANGESSIRNLAPNLKFYYFEEPRANIYALTGLRL